MRKFDKKSKFGKTDSDRSERRGSNRSNDSRSSGSDSGFQTYHATCDKCGKGCDLPFKPTGSKPVYCRTCFKDAESSGSGGRSQSFDRRDNSRSDYRTESRGRYNDKFESKNNSSVSSEDIDKINKKLDKIMKALKIE
jgi:CxxC-x17-CxxC domain-containing protein